ncbi:EAL domain-containing protein [Legionella resiliens]|uniref:EAL domain-containing protein n=1 Tax=Legionella resiliens TaxID=2905958 RepID=A0ABS8X8M2_9GAMM|nr:MULTISPECIES: EAL domain-containing protein [unclassified Legionella]MCE0723857.1 EAL domain-containing protein [Legionella sp. 9fVS26]MCE3533009.1 EAL domain-containing protein [Legionella sp. 8cVS16]
MTFFVYKQFKLFWIFFTIFLLFIFSYINWHNNVKNSFILVTEVSNKLAYNLDNFINVILQDLHQIPSYQKETLTCKDNFLPFLQYMIINHAQISGLAIRDKKHQIICSTLPHNQTFLLSQDIHRTIIGPLKIAMFNHPVIAIQKKIGDYQVEIIIMTSTLENILNVPENTQRIITLYDINQKKEIIQIGKIEGASWIDKLFLDSSYPFRKIFATAKLNSLNGVLLTVTEPDQTIINNLWHNQILVLLYVLVFSTFLYFLIRNLFNRYYSLHGAMKQAIRSGQFYPVYQPLFDAKSNSCSGAEVLLRWQDNQDEIIMPDLFIEEAENTGLIVPITLQIIETAFKEAKNILKTKPTFYLSFNICALHFTDDNFFPRFYKLVRHYSVSPKQILLEITERYLLDMNDEIYINRMQELRNAGYSLAIDDYGTGHSSISYLQYYPFNYLKIDKIFIHAIGTKAITETLNDAIIHLAKKINLTIIAEGVETKEQVNYLLQNEVQFLQGWYFSKALHIEQLIELLKGEKNE